VAENDARETARHLARYEGILVGTSSGFNVAGALAIADEIGPGKVVATVCCDSGFKYMSGDLFAEDD
jgi:cysteine synthase